MRDANVLSIKRCLPRMSWNPTNLYNLWRRSLGDKANTVDFRTTRKTLFQSRWISKALVRAYHGDFINEHSFKRWYLPPTLPDVRPRRRIGAARGDDSLELAAMAGRGRDAERELERQKEDERHALAPVGSLMFGEVERRIDVFIFRCCLAHSVYEARRLVIHGDVLLNGVKHQDANTRLAPGDMVTVDPASIRFLRRSATVPSSILAPRPPSELQEVKDQDVKTAETTTTEGAEVSTTTEATTTEGEVEATPETETNAEPEGPIPISATPEDVAARAQKSLSRAAQAAAQASQIRLKTQSSARAAEASLLASLTPFHLPPYAAPFLFVPAYAEVSFPTCSAVFVRHPTARAEYSEIPTPYEADGEVVRFAWEWYAGRRPRVRSARQRAMSPIDRKRADEPVVAKNRK